MNNAPIIVDLYCCQGAASKGYERAGFRIGRGVDIDPQSRYPWDFTQMDALEFLDRLLDGQRVGGLVLGDVAAWHASPPCQAKTKAQKIQGRAHPRLIGPTRERLEATGRPFVIENVEPENPALDEDPLKDPILLCGTMFPRLRTIRHREFESNVPITAPPHPACRHIPVVKMGRAIRETDWYFAVGNFSGVDIVRRNLELPWMNRDGLRECIPWDYAHHVGQQLIQYV